MNKGRWSTTMANAWSLLALKKFSTLYESIPVKGITDTTLDKKTDSLNWAKDPAGREISFPWPKAKEKLQISHKGSGSPWATVRSLAAIPLRQPFSSGFTIKKTLTPIEQKIKNTWSKGDLARVHLELESQANMTWVVVNDPIPAAP